MIRHFAEKLRICWYLLMDNYTYSEKQQCWWLWDNRTAILFKKKDEQWRDLEDRSIS